MNRVFVYEGSIMFHIYLSHTNGWFISIGNMQFLHITSDYRQLLLVLLEHTHQRNIALASSREFAMQGCALLCSNFAGRFNYFQFTRRRHVCHVTQELEDCVITCLRLSERQSSTPWVTCLLDWHFDGGCRKRSTHFGKCYELQISGVICLLFGASQICLGQMLFLVRNIWRCYSPESLRTTLGSCACFRSLGYSFCLASKYPILNILCIVWLLLYPVRYPLSKSHAICLFH